MKRHNLEPEYRRRIREEAENHKRNTKRIERKSDDDKRVEKIAVSISEIKQQLHQTATDDKSHKKGERRRQLWEIVMLGTAAAVGVIAIVISSVDSHEQRGVMADQVRAMRDQLNVMEEDRRPWIGARISLNSVRIIEWNGSKGIGADLKFVIKNYGQSPAINIRISPQVTSHPGNIKRNDLNPVQSRACQNARDMADSDPVGGMAIFPGVEIEKDVAPSISGRSLFDSNKRELFAVLGCISYSYASGKHGETGFRFLLGQVINGIVIGVQFREGEPWPAAPISPELLASGFPRDPPKEARVSADQFYFKEEDTGNYAK